MASNYPPGVTGRELEISGPDREWDAEGICPRCQKSGILLHQGHGMTAWAFCLDELCPAFLEGFDIPVPEVE